MPIERTDPIIGELNLRNRSVTKKDIALEAELSAKAEEDQLI